MNFIKIDIFNDFQSKLLILRSLRISIQLFFFLLLNSYYLKKKKKRLDFIS